MSSGPASALCEPAPLRCRVEMTSRPNVPAIGPSARSILRSTASHPADPLGRAPRPHRSYPPTPTSRPPRASLRLLRSARPPLRPPSLPRVRTFPRGPEPLLPRRPRRLTYAFRRHTVKYTLTTCPILRGHLSTCSSHTRPRRALTRCRGGWTPGHDGRTPAPGTTSPGGSAPARPSPARSETARSSLGALDVPLGRCLAMSAHPSLETP